MTDDIAELIERLQRLPEGPWSVERDDRDGMEWNNHVIDANGGRICFMAHSGKADNAAHEAAAHAIAALPSLFVALHALVQENERRKAQYASADAINQWQEQRIRELEAERDIFKEANGNLSAAINAIQAKTVKECRQVLTDLMNESSDEVWCAALSAADEYIRALAQTDEGED